jgi:uncharacterized membrane protein YphA (DoxX/SURF4 family)
MLIRRIARPLLSSMFIAGGIDAIRDPAGTAKAAQPVVDQINALLKPGVQSAAESVAPAVDRAADKAMDVAPDTVSDSDQATSVADTVTGAVHDTAQTGQPFPLDAETYVKVNGIAMLGAGALLSIGRLPRVASAVLAATLVPTTVAGHRFWEIDDPSERAAQQIHFMKNMSLLGGLILAAVDTQGAPGLAWRASRAKKDATRAARTARREARLVAKAATAEAHRRAAELPGPLR